MQITIDLLDDRIDGDRIYKSDSLTLVCLKRDSKRVKNYPNSSPYILFGDNALRREIYIGQTNNIGRRIKEHRFHKDFWIEIVFFVYNREFTKTETEWFERELIIEFLNANKFDMMQNSQIPKNVVINEKDRLELSNILDQIKLLLNIFGCSTSDEKASDTTLSSNAIINRIARAYKYLPEQDSSIDEEVKPNFYNNIAYYDIGGMFYIPKAEHMEKDMYLQTEEQVKQYIDTL